MQTTYKSFCQAELEYWNEFLPVSALLVSLGFEVEAIQGSTAKKEYNIRINSGRQEWSLYQENDNSWFFIETSDNIKSYPTPKKGDLLSFFEAAISAMPKSSEQVSMFENHKKYYRQLDKDDHQARDHAREFIRRHAFEKCGIQFEFQFA